MFQNCHSVHLYALIKLLYKVAHSYKNGNIINLERKWYDVQFISSNQIRNSYALIKCTVLLNIETLFFCLKNTDMVIERNYVDVKLLVIIKQNTLLSIIKTIFFYSIH